MGAKNTTTPDNGTAAQNGTGTGSTITFDPFNRLDENSNERNPEDAEAHELSHAEDNATGTNDQTVDPRTGPPGERGTEVKAVQVENLMRRANAEPFRQTGPHNGYIPNYAAPPPNPWP